MKPRGNAGAITDRDRAHKREIRERLELSAAQRTGNDSDRMVGHLVDQMTNVLLELEQRGVDVEAYLEG